MIIVKSDRKNYAEVAITCWLTNWVGYVFGIGGLRVGHDWQDNNGSQI